MMITKLITTLLTVVALCWASPPAHGQKAIDSIKSAAASPAEIINQNNDEFVDEDFSPFLFFCLIVGITIIGAGIVLTGVIVVGLFILIGAGVLSASVLVGVYNKSIKKGLFVFVVSTTTVAGVFVGTIGLWLLNVVFDWMATSTAMISGSVGGLLAGGMLGILLCVVIQKLVRILKAKLKATNISG